MWHDCATVIVICIAFLETLMIFQSQMSKDYRVGGLAPDKTSSINQMSPTHRSFNLSQMGETIKQNLSKYDKMDNSLARDMLYQWRFLHNIFVLINHNLVVWECDDCWCTSSMRTNLDSISIKKWQVSRSRLEHRNHLETTSKFSIPNTHSFAWKVDDYYQLLQTTLNINNSFH